MSVASLSNRDLGAMGERLVAYALRQRGCTILGRNVRTKYGEVDLIAKQRDVVLFVEVKTRRSRRYGYPEEAISLKKRLHMARACSVLASKYARGSHYALLVVAVEVDFATKVAKLTRIELDS